MNIIPYQYKGVYLNAPQSDVYTTVMASGFNTEISTVTISRADEAPAYGGKIVGGSHIYISVTLSDNADIPEQMSALTKLFNPLDKNLYPLLVSDADDGGRLWYVNATPTKFPMFEGNMATIDLFVADPYWRTLVKNAGAWNVTASGQQITISVAGNQYAYPKIKITPRQAKSGGYAYKRFICIWNNTSNVITDYYLDVTGQVGKALDTSALVGAGKIQSDLRDLRLFVNGKEAMYWTTGANTTTTGIHTAEITLSPKIEMTLLGSIPSSEVVSSIPCKKVSANATALKALALVQNKVIAIKTGNNLEIFTFTGVDATKYLILGVTRAQKLTAPCAHVDGDVIRWVENDIWLMYGNPSVDAMEVSDARKPMNDLLSSTNLSWYWSEFYDSNNPTRPLTWKGAALTTLNKSYDLNNVTGVYTDTQLGSANPALKMGMVVKAYFQANLWKAETGSAAWVIYDPCGTKSVTIGDGRKYKQDVTFPASCALQKSTTGTSFTTVANEAAPATKQVWTALATLTGYKTLSGTFTYIRFWMSGTVGAVANNYAAVEFGNITFEKDATKVPTIILSAEANNYYIEETITNTSNGDSVTLTAPCALNDSITIDAESRRVTHSDGTEMLAALSRSQNWIRLVGGQDNVLQIDDAGITDVEHYIEWEGRSLQ